MMKFPLRLPLCPHCGTRFFYKQVNEGKKLKTMSCPNCKKQFQVQYKKQTALLIIIAILLLIGLNCLLLAVAPFMNIVGLFLVTAVGICITYFLFPYTVRFKKQ